MEENKLESIVVKGVNYNIIGTDKAEDIIFTKNKRTDIGNTVSDFLSDFCDISLLPWTRDGDYIGNNGEPLTVPGSHKYQSTDYVNIESKSVVRIRIDCSGSVGKSFCFYNSDKKVISSYSANVYDGVFIAPDNAKYIMVCNNSENQNNPIVSIKSEQLSEQYRCSANVEENFKLINRYTLSDLILTKPITGANKKALFIGDSITVGVGASDSTKRYSSIFSSLMGFIETNKSTSGGVLDPIIANNTGRGNLSLTIENTVLSDYDYVFIAGGINDVYYGMTYERMLKVIDDICNSITTNYPNTPVYFITPLNSPSTTDMLGKDGSVVTTVEWIRRAITEIASIYGLNVIQGGDIPFPAYKGTLSSKVFADNLHPNDTGHMLYANYLYSKLK